MFTVLTVPFNYYLFLIVVVILFSSYGDAIVSRCSCHSDIKCNLTLLIEKGYLVCKTTLSSCLKTSPTQVYFQVCQFCVRLQINCLVLLPIKMPNYSVYNNTNFFPLILHHLQNKDVGCLLTGLSKNDFDPPANSASGGPKPSFHPCS